MTDERTTEIDQNYDYLQRNLSRFLMDHRDQFALIRSRKIVDFFNQAGEAYRAGLSRFPDELFSVQQVRQDPIELGHFAFDPR